MVNSQLDVTEILNIGTQNIEVLAILNHGLPYAKLVLSKLNGRGKLFMMDPRNLIIYSDETQEEAKLDIKSTLVICDDVIEDGGRFRGVEFYLSTELGYDFDKDNPPHFGAIESIINDEDFGYTDTSGLIYNKVELVRI